MGYQNGIKLFLKSTKDEYEHKVLTSRLKTLKWDILKPKLGTLEWDILKPDPLINLEINNKRRTSII